MRQKDVFLQSEGDAWRHRNPAATITIAASNPLLAEIIALTPVPTRGTRVLEVGCGDGARLQFLSETLGFESHGIDPSTEAVRAALARGVGAQQSTADRLPFDDQSFDILMFGFCLYLCDREDLFRIANEADRVLRSPGWLLIHDFYSVLPSKREYHHRPGLFSYKMDYRTLFTWHPAYTNYSQRVRAHSDDAYTDEPGEWVATSVLRKIAIT